jgi:GTPase SAR1 family protein
MSKNKELELAWEFINNTNQSIFLTGKAGTGKTTFLHRLKQKSLKRMVVVAPTGVAAINAKGVTIHSFFQIPFGPILPNTDLNGSKSFNRKFNKTKINIIKSMDLLVIDEISMVRADVLDAIDSTLKRFKNRNKVFGGVQVLMIGDLHQLSPVIKEQEWALLKDVYNTIFFFSSNAFQASNAITIELQHIYRQDDPTFIEVLNAVRSNTLTPEVAKTLNARYIPDFIPDKDEGYISLTTHNHRAKATNMEALQELKTEIKTYTAEIEGKFPEYAYPNAPQLQLKVGAQVMFVKNDSSLEKRYFNGKIGKVIHLDKDEVIVHCPNDTHNIIVTPEVWDNISYTVNKDTKAITEERIGSYTQIPLRLAWSITIHKSQGLTFEKAVIDAESAFAHGQTYVALSRCKSLEGLVLKSKIKNNQIISDGNVLKFNLEAEEKTPNASILKASQKKFQIEIIQDIFEFYDFLYPITRILDIYYKHRTVVEGNIEASFLELKTCITHFLKVANSFSNQIKELAQTEDLPVDHEFIQERFKKAIAYYNTETESKIIPLLKHINFTTDNQTVGGELTKHLDSFEDLLKVKLIYFGGLGKGLDVKLFLELRAKAVFEGSKKSKTPKRTAVDGTSNVELFEALRILRNTIAEEKGIIHFQVFTQKALYAMCETLPLSSEELLQINGMGKTRVEKYGTAIVDVIKTYCEANGIETNNTPLVFNSSTEKTIKENTKNISLKLFEQGKTIKAIADYRALNENTIFGHLAHFIDTGEVKVSDLIPENHYNELKGMIPQKKFENLSDLKQQLDEKYSYAELRLMLKIL